MLRSLSRHDCIRLNITSNVERLESDILKGRCHCRHQQPSLMRMPAFVNSSHLPHPITLIERQIEKAPPF